MAAAVAHDYMGNTQCAQVLLQQGKQHISVLGVILCTLCRRHVSQRSFDMGQTALCRAVGLCVMDISSAGHDGNE